MYITTPMVFIKLTAMLAVIQLLVVQTYGQPTKEATVNVDGFLEMTEKCNPGDLKCQDRKNDDQKRAIKINMKCYPGSLICPDLLHPIAVNKSTGNLRLDMLNSTVRSLQDAVSSTQTLHSNDHTRPSVKGFSENNHSMTYSHPISKESMQPIPELKATTAAAAHTNIGNIYSDMDDHNRGIDGKYKKQPVGEIVLLLVCGILVGLWLMRRHETRNKRRLQNIYQ